MKLNLVCGNKKLEGFINIDLTEYCNPDLLLDLENTPYPFKSNSVSEIRMKSVMEHLPVAPNKFFKILQEIYRISANNCVIKVECPHPHHRWQVVDFTHQKPIHYEGIQMLSKNFASPNSAGKHKNASGHHIRCRLREITEYSYNLDPQAQHHIERVLGSFNKELISSYVHLFNNIAATQKFTLSQLSRLFLYSKKVSI